MTSIPLLTKRNSIIRGHSGPLFDGCRIKLLAFVVTGTRPLDVSANAVLMASFVRFLPFLSVLPQVYDELPKKLFPCGLLAQAVGSYSI